MVRKYVPDACVHSEQYSLKHGLLTLAVDRQLQFTQQWDQLRFAASEMPVLLG